MSTIFSDHTKKCCLLSISAEWKTYYNCLLSSALSPRLSLAPSGKCLDISSVTRMKFVPVTSKYKRMYTKHNPCKWNAADFNRFCFNIILVKKRKFWSFCYGITENPLAMDDFNHKTIFVLDHTQYFGMNVQSKSSLLVQFSCIVLSREKSLIQLLSHAHRYIGRQQFSIGVRKYKGEWIDCASFKGNTLIEALSFPSFWWLICNPFVKLQSLWTTSIETAAEYCRIVWDLFPTGKYVSAHSRSFRLI